MRSTRVNEKNKNAHKGILNNIKHVINRNKLGELLVLQGKITPYELKHALKTQQDTGKPLGKILQELNLISKNQLSRLLFKQRVLRIAATSMLYMMSCSSFVKTSNAAEIKDVPAKIILASASGTTFKSIGNHPALFGAKEKKSTNLKAFTKWTSMFERFDRDLKKSKSKRVIKAFKAEISKYRSDSIYDMSRKVNTMMNKKKYIVDSKNWGKSDYWATPIEFMTRGGDCEDYAIAKYAALRMLGVPENRMRIAIVQDMKKNTPHAILIVYSEKGAILLDNQIDDIRYTSNIRHYKPIFSINRVAWWLHTVPQKASNTIIAAAK